MNGRLLTVFLIALGLLLGALVVRSATLALMALPFLAYLGIGFREAPSGAEVRLRAERTVELSRTGEAAAVRVRIAVRNEGAPVPVLRLSEMPQEGMTGVDPPPEQAAGLPAGAETELAYTAHSTRGLFRWKTIHATVSDPFRLFETELDLPAEGEIVVRPRVRRFRSFPLRVEHTLHSPGLLPAGIAGSGTDFWGVREYQPGDQMRRLDWRRAARHPGQFFTKELEQEEIADVGLVLDARPRGDVRRGNDSLFDHALDATASLAETLLRRGNRAGLVLLGNTVDVVYPGYGKVQLNRILRILANARPRAAASWPSLNQVPLRVFSSRAMIVIVSPLGVGEWQVFPRLRARGNEGLLISPDPVDFVKGDARDAAGLLALRLARLERRFELSRISQLGIRVIDWQVGKPLSPLVRRALQRTRGQG